MRHAFLLAMLSLSAPALAQVGFGDPAHLVPRIHGTAAADANTGDLYVLGGRNDRALDLWRLRNGAAAFEKVADEPFRGVAFSSAYDAARNRLVTVLRTETAGNRMLVEHDGTGWRHPVALPDYDQQLLYDPVRQLTLLWMRPASSANGQLHRWDGTSLTAVPGPALPSGALAFDTARGVAVVARHDMVHEWNGAAWTTIAAVQPQMLYWQFVSDPTSGRAVAIGTDYWLGTPVGYAWNGQGWVPWPLAGMPPRSWPLLAGNGHRQRLQLVGGGDPYARNDAFEFDGTTWQQVVADTADPVFHGPCLVATGSGTALLFDGGDNSGPVRTARWQQGSYTQLQPTHAPSSRRYFAMAGDPATGRAWLFGGQDGSGPLGDFWLWNGSDWQALPGGPPARWNHGMCFDSVRQRVVLYGGSAGNDTWEFDGAAWQLRSANFPPHLYDANLAYDPLRRRSVLVTYGLVGREVWEWDGIGWYSTNPAHRPAGTLSNLLVAYDPVRHQVVAVDPTGTSGVPSLPYGDAHAWDGTDWRLVATDSRLARASALVGIPGVGIRAQAGLDRYGVTLTHAFPALAASFGTSCEPLRHLTASRNPWLGTTYTLRYPVNVGLSCLFTTGLSNTAAGAVPLPLDLAPYGFPGCHLYVSPDIVHVRPWNYDAAYLDVALPPDPAFAGVRLFHQGVVFDPFRNLTSQGLEVQIGSLW